FSAASVRFGGRACVTGVSRRGPRTAGGRSGAGSAERARRRGLVLRQLGTQRLGHLQLAARARLVVLAGRRIAARVEAKVALAQRVGAKARRELDGDRQRAGRD